jgi:hypothetical protein
MGSRSLNNLSWTLDILKMRANVPLTFQKTATDTASHPDDRRIHLPGKLNIIVTSHSFVWYYAKHVYLHKYIKRFLFHTQTTVCAVVNRHDPEPCGKPQAFRD